MPKELTVTNNAVIQFLIRFSLTLRIYNFLWYIEKFLQLNFNLDLNYNLCRKICAKLSK